MKPRVLAEAEAELLSAILYYEARQEGLGHDLLERISETIASILEDPKRYPIYEGKRLSRVFRRAAVDRFPYIVVYQIRDNETLVVAIAHSSREPGYWEGRESR